MTCLPTSRQGQALAGQSKLFPLARVGAASAVALMMSSSPAWALALGRLTVQSTLGEPLRAEIDIAEINADEAASLMTTLAQPAFYKASGLEFPAALGKVQIKLQQRADKRSYLQISNEKAINEPFVDLILEARWASGRLIRDYTLLFSPPTLAIDRPNTSPNLAQVPAATREPTAEVSLQPVKSNAPITLIPGVGTSEPLPAKAGKTLRVEAGDTANKIATEHKPAHISLDQMLVALLRTNPQAFLQDNINWIKRGALLQLPSEEALSSIPLEEAHDIVVAQSKDFKEFRKNLASQPTRLSSPSADRQAQGNVQTQVTASKPATAVSDKLTLSKDTSIDARELDAIASTRQKTEDEQRAADIGKNIASLQKISTEAGAAGGQPPSEPPALTSTTMADPARLNAASETKANSATAATLSSPPSATTSPATSDFLEAFLRHPLVIPATGVLLAVLGAFGFYKSRQQRERMSPYLPENTLSAEPTPDTNNRSEGADGTRAADLDLELNPELSSSQAQDTTDFTATAPPLEIDFDEPDPLQENPVPDQSMALTAFDFKGLSLDLDTPPEIEVPEGETSQDAPPQASAPSKTLNQITH